MKLGVYICHCGLNIAGSVDVEEVQRYAEALEDVTVARDIDYTCSDLGQETIKNDIKEHNLDRVIVASCSPRMHEKMFQRCIREGGLNPFLFEMVNIREQCSWVHPTERAAATQKAKDLIRMGVAKARLLAPLEPRKIPVKQTALVIGGGVTGIHAALELADNGIQVILVEKSPSIGGMMARLNEIFPTNDCSICVLAPKMVDADSHENITIHTNAEVESVEGTIGNFKARIKKHPKYVDPDKCKGCIEDCATVCPVEVLNESDFGIGKRKAIYLPIPQAVPLIASIDPESCVGCKLCEEACEADAIDFQQKEEEIEVEVGAIIVATGYQLFNPHRKPEYRYGGIPDIITNIQLERMLNASGPTRGNVQTISERTTPKKMAFIQCVGSRDEKVGNPYCSGICCMIALKNSQLTKERYPDTEIKVFYIDIRAVGEGYEEYYRRAENLGVKFVRGRVSSVEPGEDNKPILHYEDTLAGIKRKEEFDLVVLSTGLEPHPGTKEIANTLNLIDKPDRFLAVVHPKMKPVDAHMPGMFIAGCASGPKDIQGCIAQGTAASSRVLRLLGKGEIEVDPLTAYVIEDLCQGCKLCEDVCQFEMIHVKDKKAYVDEEACRGCGSCAAACPSNAIILRGFTNEQIMAQIDAALSVRTEHPHIIAFLCNWCSYAGADIAGSLRISYPTNVRIIRMMCSAMVDPRFVLDALQKGADGVLVAGCHLGECHYIHGNYDADRRMNVLKKILSELGFDEHRLRVEWISASEGEKFANVVEEFTEELLELGPMGTELGFDEQQEDART